jgi:hypothetical protein
MNLRYHRLASLLLLGGVLLVPGCKPPPSKAKFNNGIAEANQKLGQRAMIYRKTLVPQTIKEFDPDKVDRTALGTAWDEMDKALRDVKDKYADPDFVLPRRSPASEALKTTYDDYLTAQSTILDLAKDINDALADPKLDKAEKKKKVEGLLDEIRKTEDAAFKKLEDAQKGVAEAHNFRVVPKLDAQ